jgi:hypothetical protein
LTLPRAYLSGSPIKLLPSDLICKYWTWLKRFAREKYASIVCLVIKIKAKILILTSGPNVIKLFTAVIYCHSIVILSFCVIKLYYFGNYRGMAVNYHGILTLEKVGLEVLR